MHDTLQRRRRVLGALASLAIVTFVLAIAAAAPGLWTAQVVVDMALLVYVAVLLHLRNAAAGVEMVTRLRAADAAVRRP